MEMGFRWDFAYEILPQMLWATLNTIIAAGVGYAIALVVGLFFLLGQRTPSKIVNAINREIVEFIRSTPLLIQLFFGLTGVIILTVYVVNSLKKIKSVNYDLYLIGIFISINLIKSDSLLYLPSLLLYGMFFVLINNKEHIYLKK